MTVQRLHFSSLSGLRVILVVKNVYPHKICLTIKHGNNIWLLSVLFIFCPQNMCFVFSMSLKYILYYEIIFSSVLCKELLLWKLFSQNSSNITSFLLCGSNVLIYLFFASLISLFIVGSSLLVWDSPTGEVITTV